MEYQQIKFFGMACWWWCPGVSTAALFSHFCVWGVVGKAVRGVGCRVVFGALLGPEATGPFLQQCRESLVFLVVPAAGTPSCLCGVGVVDGVVV